MLPLLAALTAVSLAAAPRPPLAPASAPLALHIKEPRAGLPALRGFLAEAGAWAPLLRPTGLGRDLVPLLGADLFDADSLAEAGIDVEAPMTLSFLHEATVLCAIGTKGTKALERGRAQFAGAGQLARQGYKGALLEGAAAGKIWKAGVASKGRQLCFASGGSDALAALRQTADALAGAGLAGRPAAKAGAALEAPVVGYFQSSEANGAFEVKPAGRALTLAGRAVVRRALLDRPRDADPLAGLAADAPLVARATLSAKALADPRGPVAGAFGFLVSRACAGCDPALAKGLHEVLRPQLVGSLGLVVRGLDPTAAIEPEAKYFLVAHAYLLPVKDPEATEKILEGALAKMKEKGAHVVPVDGQGWSIAFGAREVRVGVAQGALFIANDKAARELALAALARSKPGKPEYAFSFRAMGPLATGELRRISVLDITKSVELAALFAAGVEVGALLKAAGPIQGWADPDGPGLRFETGFELAPSKL